MKGLRRLWRRVTNRYSSMTCRSCGYIVPFTGNRWEQASRAYDHFEALHDTVGYGSQSEGSGS